MKGYYKYKGGAENSPLLQGLWARVAGVALPACELAEEVLHLLTGDWAFVGVGSASEAADEWSLLFEFFRGFVVAEERGELELWASPEGEVLLIGSPKVVGPRIGGPATPFRRYVTLSD